MTIRCNWQTAVNFALSAGIAWLVQRIPMVEDARILAATKKSFMLVKANRKAVDNLDPRWSLFLSDSPDIMSHVHAILAFVQDSFDVTERELQDDTGKIFRCISANRNEFQTLSVDLIQTRTIMPIATVVLSWCAMQGKRRSAVGTT